MEFIEELAMVLLINAMVCIVWSHATKETFGEFKKRFVITSIISPSLYYIIFY
jgi:hypothetical protein